MGEATADDKSHLVFSNDQQGRLVSCQSVYKKNKGWDRKQLRKRQ